MEKKAIGYDNQTNENIHTKNNNTNNIDSHKMININMKK